MGAILNPHDALFKAVLGQPEHARGMLRTIVPPPLAAALDWPTLTLRPGSFVDAAFTHQHTDLLYSAAWSGLAPNGLAALAQVMRYILEVNKHVAAEALQDLLEPALGPEAKDAIVTTGQQLIEQGRQQGIEQGRQQGIEQGRQQGIEQGRQQGVEQGRQQGRQQGVQELLLRLLRQRFGDAVDARVEQRIAGASVEQLEAWSVGVLAATTLAEALDGGT